MEITVEEYNAYNPLSAYLDGKTDSEQGVVLGRFVNLPESEKLVLVGTDTAEAIANLIVAGTLPQSYGKAVAKIIYLVLAGEVQPAGVSALLERLGLSTPLAQQVSSVIGTLAAPVVRERAVTPVAMPELPPLTQRVPPVMPGPDSSKTPARNIIDLRK